MVRRRRSLQLANYFERCPWGRCVEVAWSPGHARALAEPPPPPPQASLSPALYRSTHRAHGDARVMRGRKQPYGSSEPEPAVDAVVPLGAPARPPRSVTPRRAAPRHVSHFLNAAVRFWGRPLLSRFFPHKLCKEGFCDRRRYEGSACPAPQPASSSVPPQPSPPRLASCLVLVMTSPRDRAQCARCITAGVKTWIFGKKRDRYRG